MNEPLFEIENWRGRWYYKFGSHYTGPFAMRSGAVAAARREGAILNTHWRKRPHPMAGVTPLP